MTQALSALVKKINASCEDNAMEVVKFLWPRPAGYIMVLVDYPSALAIVKARRKGHPRTRSVTRARERHASVMRAVKKFLGKQ